MGKYIFRRLLGVIPTLLTIMTISFIIMRLAPGGPFDGDKNLPPEVQKTLEAQYHLDKPIWEQYFYYLADLLKGDLGPSLKQRDFNVSYFIENYLPNSILLGVIALTLSITLGVTLGTLAALHKNTWIDYLCSSTSILGISIPVFVVGPVLQYFLAIKMGWLPSSGWIDNQPASVLIMPVITLALPSFAYISRLSRGSVLEILKSDYIRTARAKGLSEGTIVLRHVLKGSLLPVITYLGPAFAAIITEGVVIEKIFRIPGIGRYFVDSALSRDYPLIMGTVLVYSFILIMANLIVDIIYGFLDPRISYE